MSNYTYEFTAKRIVFESALSASDVAKRLDESTGHVEPGTPIMRFFNEAKSREDVENVVRQINGPDKSFLYVALLKFQCRVVYI